jgi:hypothetical protein
MKDKDIKESIEFINGILNIPIDTYWFMDGDFVYLYLSNYELKNHSEILISNDIDFNSSYMCLKLEISLTHIRSKIRDNKINSILE